MPYCEETMQLFKRILQKKKPSFSDFFCYAKDGLSKTQTGFFLR